MPTLIDGATSSGPGDALPRYGQEVCALFEDGIAETPYAWYGTGIEAILHLAETGELPKKRARGAYLFYAPEHLKPGEQQRQAIHRAQEAGFIEAAGRGATRGALQALAPGYNADRNGVVIRLSEQIREDYEEKGDKDSCKVSIWLPAGQGLAIDYMTGIEPMGEYEWSQLEVMQQAIDRFLRQI